MLHIQLKSSLFKKLALPVTGIIIVGGYFIFHSTPVPTQQEFFEHNTHLSKPRVKVPPESLPVRNSDAFQDGDFHLTAGRLYPITVKEEAELKGGGKELFKSSYRARLDLHSLGLRDRKLQLIAEFHFEAVSNSEKIPKLMKTEIGMKDFAPKKEENLLLISLDPSGVITDVRVAAQPLTEQGTRLKVNSIVPLFKRLPLLKPGKLSRIEGDERGIPYSIQYTGTDVGNNQLKITGLVSDVQQLGNTPSKAAAAGAPNLALVGLESSQEQSFDWRWDTALKLPISQNFGAIAGTRQFGQDVSNSHIQFEAIWAPSVAARFTPADAERFKYSVDFKKFLSASGSRMKEMEQMTKKQLLGKTPGQILGQVGNLKNSKLTDLQKDELFIDLGKALKSDPSLIDNAKQLALTGEPDSRQNSMALGALGFEGSAQSQAAMIEVYLNPRATADEKQKVLTELAICPEPLSKETKTFLKAKYKEADPMVSDFASTAGLALGSSIARDGDPETVKLLQSEWEKTSGFFTARQDQDKQVYLLSAMGNSKSNVFQDQVKTAARSSHDEVRAAAVHSVRFAQDDYSRNLIRTSIKSDSSTDVKLSAAQALRYQPFDEATRQLLIDCSQDSHIGVKIQCYRVLTSRLEQPGIRQLLSSRLNSESDDQVRGLLQAALDTKE